MSEIPAALPEDNRQQILEAFAQAHIDPATETVRKLHIENRSSTILCEIISEITEPEDLAAILDFLPKWFAKRSLTAINSELAEYSIHPRIIAQRCLDAAVLVTALYPDSEETILDKLADLTQPRRGAASLALTLKVKEHFNGAAQNQASAAWVKRMKEFRSDSSKEKGKYDAHWAYPSAYAATHPEEVVRVLSGLTDREALKVGHWRKFGFDQAVDFHFAEGVYLRLLEGKSISEQKIKIGDLFKALSGLADAAIRSMLSEPDRNLHNQELISQWHDRISADNRIAGYGDFIKLGILLTKLLNNDPESVNDIGGELSPLTEGKLEDIPQAIARVLYVTRIGLPNETLARQAHQDEVFISLIDMVLTRTAAASLEAQPKTLMELVTMFPTSTTAELMRLIEGQGHNVAIDEYRKAKAAARRRARTDRNPRAEGRGS